MKISSTLLLLSTSTLVRADDSFPWLNPDLPSADRVNALLNAVTDEELLGQLNSVAPGIDRLKIPAYDWWGEASHGIGWAGRATVFPCSEALAATFDVELLREAGLAIGKEGRAKHNNAVRASADGSTSTFEGLNFFAPNLNLVHDPRWG
ncbi:hypothetical protein TrLO_g107 [Triparma laevis f. longispina]|uniref:Beta-glucosidase n=1 Tax=Triparma laevis f. longispina TaxID=1714387 RepID=A0A9W7C787_9STRA|nr:hypothetical protein TrLO_g107 [Triparma laevis f. longispina]